MQITSNYQLSIRPNYTSKCVNRNIATKNINFCADVIGRIPDPAFYGIEKFEMTAGVKDITDAEMQEFLKKYPRIAEGELVEFLEANPYADLDNLDKLLQDCFIDVLPPVKNMLNFYPHGYITSYGSVDTWNDPNVQQANSSGHRPAYYGKITPGVGFPYVVKTPEFYEAYEIKEIIDKIEQYCKTPHSDYYHMGVYRDSLSHTVGKLFKSADDMVSFAELLSEYNMYLKPEDNKYTKFLEMAFGYAREKEDVDISDKVLMEYANKTQLDFEQVLEIKNDKMW